MRVEVVARAPHQVEAGNALIAGFRCHGIRTTNTAYACGVTEQVVACWGWRIGKLLAVQGRRVLVMERGYVGDRMKWTSLAWDGLNGRGEVPAVDDGGQRWRKHFGGLMKPWRADGSVVVVMGQVPGDASIEGVDIDGWYEKACQAAKRFGLPVMFRPHPVAIQSGHHGGPAGVTVLRGSLEQALLVARYVVTYNSNSGVDAVLAGVPTVACDVGSMAWKVCGRSLEADPPSPDRSAWCSALAWRQWTHDEIERGEAWDYLRASL